MKILPSLFSLSFVFITPTLLPAESKKSRLSVPDKLVVLTFDDGNASDLHTVAPILKEHGFGATFFITSGWIGGEKRLRWPEVVKLQEAGFEIGCHTTTHPNLLRLGTEELRKQIAGFDQACVKHGILKAVSFSYPGGHFDRRMLAILEERGYRLARRGRDPEFPLEDNGGTGRAYLPGEDHPFLIPSMMTRGVGALADEQVIHALSQAKCGAISVFTYHGVPDVNRHCSTPLLRFRKDMQYLKDSGATVIALRDLERYVDLAKRPKDPFAPIVRRLGVGAEKITCDAGGAVPLFSWELVTHRWTQEQAAYRILVASSATLLDRDQGDLWDSGKVVGTQRADVPCGGKVLKPATRYWWKVQCWNRRDEAEIAKNTPYQSEEMITELHKSRAGQFSEVGSFKTSSGK